MDHGYSQQSILPSYKLTLFVYEGNLSNGDWGAAVEL